MKEELEQLQNKIQFHFNLLTTDLGFFNSHKNYTKFIVLSQARSGSNFLLSLLGWHDRVVTYGELFVSPDSIGWHRDKYEEYLQSKSLIRLMRDNPREFLEKKVFRKYPSPVSAVGFKIFYDQAQEGSVRTVWDFLQSQREIKVIHLKRKNMLKTLLSLEKALITNEWVVIDSDPKSSQTKTVMVSLDYEKCLQYFNRTWESMQEHDRWFDRHPKIDVFYEDLSRDKVGEMLRIQNFLDLEYKTVQSFTVKQSCFSLSESISNYFDLKEKFQNTPWASFFED